jgi:hypothetical protein
MIKLLNYSLVKIKIAEIMVILVSSMMEDFSDIPEISSIFLLVKMK